ncbi:HCCA isomerase/glutathione S-transferase kappa [Aaosphaeria arxii CBS 175.79]|uniref:Glutathione S-transferase kappa n=1 Tax=Aaosphaeria arxii CBS 175.79 TaxID=1450172 RepID=A0A6A5XSG8_9PLEO|nr:HCCA isomerase/glutathione S-transferase kappa [Aaosphaeria arxii CBS 175.79]KAF2015883.1 HCCA isomerase/glutathione S-transferase kappa [Aaosphaeria arxii CBS 175.79]
MGNSKITLYLDVVSPFAYIGFYALQNLAIFKDCDITYVPIFLGGLMKACGNTPPIMVKNKGKWINLERKRWAKYFNVPMSDRAPPGFPINTLPIQRVLVSLSLSHPELIPKAFDAFYKDFWVQWKEPHKPENIFKLVAEIVGSEEEAKNVIDGCGSDEVKRKVMENTDQAFKDGAFGLPWFVATNSKGETESFWGIDHLGQLIDHLGLQRPNDGAFRALL